MRKIRNVLSLFDGISCGRVALERVGLEYQNYYASEIDKYAIQIAQNNFPNTIQLGDVKKWRDWDLPPIDLLMGGSPCQGFTFAGKQLNFDDPRSKLFFEFVDILNHYKPKYFLLENVIMKQEYQDIISDYLGVQPIKINSALVSAQNRNRLYWTNIPDISQPLDKEIILKDVLEDDESIESFVNYYDIMKPVKSKSNRVGILGNGSQGNRIYDTNKKSVTLMAERWGPTTGLYLTGQKIVRKLMPNECERLQNLPDNYTKGVSNNQRYKMLGNGWTVDVIRHILSNIL